LIDNGERHKRNHLFQSERTLATGALILGIRGHHDLPGKMRQGPMPD